MRWLVLLAFAALLILGVAATMPALGHVGDQPELNAWFNELKSSGGALCCSNNDGKVVADADWSSTRDGKHYRVFIEGEWRVVPDEAVINVPNKSGRTMVWPVRGILGLTIRCFMPGAGI